MDKSTLDKRTITEIAGVLATVFLLDRLYAVTGGVWFEHLAFWLRPLPLILPLIPFLVLVVGPASKRAYDITTGRELAAEKTRSARLDHLASTVVIERKIQHEGD